MKVTVIVAFLSLFFATFQLSAQDCSKLIAEDKNIEGTHILRMKTQTLVVRGTYSYSIELMTDDKGVIARVYSKAGVDFNLGDEIIFMDNNNIRKSYRFIEMGEMSTEGTTPVHSNILQAGAIRDQYDLHQKQRHQPNAEVHCKRQPPGLVYRYRYLLYRGSGPQQYQ